jgi:hypothetical protein
MTETFAPPIAATSRKGKEDICQEKALASLAQTAFLKLKATEEVMKAAGASASLIARPSLWRYLYFEPASDGLACSAPMCQPPQRVDHAQFA